MPVPLIAEQASEGPIPLAQLQRPAPHPVRAERKHDFRAAVNDRPLRRLVPGSSRGRFVAPLLEPASARASGVG